MSKPGSCLHQGTEIHRKIQAEAEDDYQPEVRLSCEIDFDGFTILTEGIADGIIPDKEATFIDEIKSTSMPLELIDEDYSFCIGLRLNAMVGCI
jgi:DNA excision repair protein ERCC-2